MTVFNRKKVNTLKQPMFFGEPLNTQRYDDFKYPIFDKLTHKIGIKLANTPFRYILIKLDNFFGNRKKPSEWWANK